MWKTRHVAMISWWPFNLSSKGIQRIGAAQGQARYVSSSSFTGNAAESQALRRFRSLTRDAQPVAEVTRFGVQRSEVAVRGFGWEEDAPTEER